MMECVPEGGTARAHTSWTNGSPNYGNSRENVVRANQINRKNSNIIVELNDSLYKCLEKQIKHIKSLYLAN